MGFTSECHVSVETVGNNRPMSRLLDYIRLDGVCARVYVCGFLCLYAHEVSRVCMK